MPKPIDEDRARRKQMLEQKRSARRAKEQEKAKADDDNINNQKVCDAAATKSQTSQRCALLALPEDAIQLVYTNLSAAELGCLTMTCKSLNRLLPNARIPYLLSRLNRPNSPSTGTVGFTQLCGHHAQAQQLLSQALMDDTGRRMIPRGQYSQQTTNEFIAYARFLEEIVTGYSTLKTQLSQKPIFLPQTVQGRFVSVSPEHSLVRVGGDGETCGAGGSGVASFGVGKRGQLGHGQRQDEKYPRMLLGGLGYGIRIVQVSAGGGLVRVAHSLLLTSTGQVLSFGTGQHGALGHGYSAAKQLPDQLQPQYVEALAGIPCICVAAGELHSAVVTADGDVYVHGDGFCGQLGLGDKRPQLTPRQVTLGGLEDECVISITCGSRHTVAVTEEGQVFSWGLGHFGVLGRSFTPFDYDADAAVVAFAGGGDNNGPLMIAGGGMGRRNENLVAVAAAAPPPLVQDNERNRSAEVMAHLDLIANLSLDDSSNQCFPKLIEALQGINIVGASAGHRHTLLLDANGGLYSCGAGKAGCLGHGDTLSQMYPTRITSLDDDGVRIRQMSSGVDISMAVSTDGTCYAWGRTDGGRIGLGLARGEVLLPRRVNLVNDKDEPIKAVDVDCGYVHSLIVGLDGTLHLCGGVGIDGQADGQQEQEEDDNLESSDGRPRMVKDFNIWHRVPEPKQEQKKSERWSKYGKYEVKGRSKMMSETYDHT